MRFWLVALLPLACAAKPARPTEPAATGPGGSPRPADSGAFWAAWGDGKAEVDTYHLVQPRYGALRDGTATLIYVTEDFSWSERVKADPGAHPAEDLRPVLKLNASRDFITGVYPYHVMTSVFTRVEPGDGMRALDPLKLTFSATEWCGMVYEEWVPSAGALARTAHTYFDADTRPPRTEAVPADVIYEDALPILVRGLRGDWLAPGGVTEVPSLPSFLEARFAHTEAAVRTLRVERSAPVEPRVVDGVTVEVERWTTRAAGGPATTWFVERDGARRLVAWEVDSGERAELVASVRMPYWQLNKAGDEAQRAALRLPEGPVLPVGVAPAVGAAGGVGVGGAPEGAR